MKNYKSIAVFAVMATLLVVPAMAGAQIIVPDLPGTEGSETFTELVTKILQILLAVVGLVAVIFLIWGGFKYITSAGEEDNLEKAKKTVINALIGVVIVLIAFALVRIVANAILGGAGGL